MLVRLPWLCSICCPGYFAWFAVVMLHGLPLLGCMGCPGCIGCRGYVASVVVVMLHWLPWLCCLFSRGYVAWVAVVMLHGLPWLCCTGCRGYVAWVAMVRFFMDGGVWQKNFKESSSIICLCTVCVKSMQTKHINPNQIMSINSHHVSVIQKSEILVVCGFKCSWIKGGPSLSVGVDAPYYRTTR